MNLKAIFTVAKVADISWPQLKVSKANILSILLPLFLYSTNILSILLPLFLYSTILILDFMLNASINLPLESG